MIIPQTASARGENLLSAVVSIFDASKTSSEPQLAFAIFITALKTVSSLEQKSHLPWSCLSWRTSEMSVCPHPGSESGVALVKRTATPPMRKGATASERRARKRAMVNADRVTIVAT